MPSSPFTSPRRWPPRRAHPVPGQPPPHAAAARLHLRGLRGSAAAAARARLRRPAGARRVARVDGRHPALASPPPVSSLTPPGPRRRRLRRRALRRLSGYCSSGRIVQPRVAYIDAPVSSLPCPSADLCRWTAPPSGAPAGLRPWGGGGRLFQAQLRREICRERARSPRDCADCWAPGGAHGTPRTDSP